MWFRQLILDCCGKMDSLKDIIFEFHPDTLEVVRRDINLDSPKRLNEALNLLEDWIKKQNHFVRKEFPRRYLEETLVTAKGLMERAKGRLDKLCTFKTLMPEFYPNPIAREQFIDVQRLVTFAHLPKLTKEHYRIIFVQVLSDDFRYSDIMAYYKYATMMCEYQKMHDYNNGIVFILDVRNINIFNLLTKLSPLEFKNFFLLTTEGYGSRVKRTDILSESKMVDSLVIFFKQMFSAKLGKRIYTHKSLDTIYEAVGRDIMPVDYGGKEASLKELNEIWRDTLFSKNTLDYINDIYQAKTDENCRRADKFNENYIGMPGSFRTLTVD